MAQKVIREFIDDIDGSVAERTFPFSVDGVSYEIDLSSSNIDEFKQAVGGFVESARKVATGHAGKRGRKPAAAGGGGVKPARSREQAAAIRDWARQHGHHVSDRGRISAEVQQAFDAAHGHLTAVN